MPHFTLTSAAANFQITSILSIYSATLQLSTTLTITSGLITSVSKLIDQQNTKNPKPKPKTKNQKQKQKQKQKQIRRNDNTKATKIKAKANANAKRKQKQKQI